MQGKDLFLTFIGTARSGPSLKRRVMWAVNSPRMSKSQSHHCTGRRVQKHRKQPTVANQPDRAAVADDGLTSSSHGFMREDRYFLATFDGDDVGLWPGSADDATWTIAPVVRESDGLLITLSDGVTP